MELKNLSETSRSEFKSFLNSFDTILCDCDGVTWHFKTGLPSVKESLTNLRKHGKQINFVSNNTTVTISTFLNDLNNCGFEVKPEEVANPNLAIIDYLKKTKFNKKIFMIGAKLMKKEFSDAGFILADSGPDFVDEDVAVVSRHVQDDEDVGAIICDIDVNANFMRLCKALVYLKRPDVLFIIGGNDKTLPIGLPVPLVGPRYFQIPLEELSGRSPMSFGKPAPSFNDFIVKRFGIKEPGRTLFIGDNLEQDIGFATEHGYQTLLVLTGATNLAQASNCTSKNMIPNYYLNSLGDLNELIKQKIDV